MCLIVFLYAMQKLPQFPLPTHDVIDTGWLKFEEAINLEVVKLPTTALIQLVGSSDLRIIKKKKKFTMVFVI